MGSVRDDAIHQCEWCQCDKMEVHEDAILADDGGETPVYQAICLGCGAAGSLAESPASAVAAWESGMRAIGLAASVAPAAAEAIEAMQAATRDIQEWRQLGRRWQSESPDYGRDPMCPTDAGMAASEAVIYRVAMATKRLRALGLDDPADDRPAEWPEGYDGNDRPTPTDFLNG